MNALVYRPLAGRRATRSVRVGKLAIGGENPIRVQSMITSDTMDTEACINETLALVAAGCEIVRITAPTVQDAKNLEHIRAGLLSRGCDVPLVADIHFKPDAALEAARWVDKVRINPGNFADSKKFLVREYSDLEYEAEIGRIRERFMPLVHLCKERGVSMRIGTNHGSLSDRIMNRYGDSPAGMVESAVEFARLAREWDYHDIVFSMKSSNPKVMIQAYRMLVARLDALSAEEPEKGNWDYPIHLGVTEAGDGEDGRIKSAIGIGSLLFDGIGDTIRVSLTEDSVHEIPVARELVALAEQRWSSRTAFRLDDGSASMPPVKPGCLPFDPFAYSRRDTAMVSLGSCECGAGELVRVGRVGGEDVPPDAFSNDCRPEFSLSSTDLLLVDPVDDAAVEAANALTVPKLVSIPDSCRMNVVSAFRMLAARLVVRHPILIKDSFSPSNGNPLLNAAANVGALLCDGIGDAILVRGNQDPVDAIRLSYNILQAAGVRMIKTDYVACPSCGRTLFHLQDTTARIKAATGHLKGLRIAVMGCIVNGPGEMADADFGYVGGAPGKINLYVGKQAVEFNIPEQEAVQRLVDLIRKHGRWVEPPAGSL